MTDQKNPRPAFLARPALRGLAVALVLLQTLPPALAQTRQRNGDYIVAIVNQELVTAGEVDGRVQRVLAEVARSGARPPAEAQLRKEVLDVLIDERVIIGYARESGVRVEEPEIDRAVQSVAAQNQLTPEQLRERLAAEGTDFARFRTSLRDQMMIERVREREVYGRIRVSDEDVEKYLQAQRQALAADANINLAQILVTVPEGADDATVAARKARIDAALARVKAGEDFAAVAREVSEDGNRDKGGEIGPRAPSRLPDLFVEATRGLAQGELTPQPVRSGAGFHVLKVLQKADPNGATVTQTRARHILLRASAQAKAEVSARRLAEFKRQIDSGTKTFEELARQFSEDGSAPSGGELGWSGPGTMVPEFEDAMNKLPIGGVSPPVVSRFGVHLIQVLERRQVAQDLKQAREQARGVLREQRFEGAYNDWAKDLRNKAYLELREPPQ
jgi:peptidyl-prolyl cis-trans isomerase SurA